MERILTGFDMFPVTILPHNGWNLTFIPFSQPMWRRLFFFPRGAEKTGIKVSSLYISQIKRKCGLEVGENFNKAKSEDAKVPICPPEKEAAIVEALKHFGMI